MKSKFQQLLKGKEVYQMKKIMVYLVAAAMVFTVFGFNTSEADAAVGYNKIGRVGAASKTVNAGNSFELEVVKGSKVKDSNLWWSVGNSGIVKIIDSDRSDDEIDLKAVKAGTTKVYCKNKLTGGNMVYTITVKKSSNKISRIGEATRTYNKGREFELGVKLGGAISENSVKWTIVNTDIVGYDDDDRYDNDMEFYAKKAGTTKITAKNLVTGGTIVYTIKVKQPADYYIVKVGASTKTVEVGDDRELQVSKGAALSSSKIKWSIEKPSILRFEDGDNIGTAVEVEGLKTGTTKVYVKNLHTGGQHVYTIKVVPDYDD